MGSLFYAEKRTDSERIMDMLTKMTIAEIKGKLSTMKDLEDPFVAECRNDSRKGIQMALKSLERTIAKEQLQREHFESICAYEHDLRRKGYRFIAGVDEAGRGPLAGPVVAAAVILPEDFYLPGLNDSKQLSASRREEYFHYIHEHAIAVSTGIIHSVEIDEINIYEAAKKAMLEAISHLEVSPDYCLIDAMEVPLPIEQLSLIKGDAKSASIAAASVIAKETRDRMMMEYAERHPEYGFEKHMGYGTKSHLEAIDRFGPTDWHRMTFAPLKHLNKEDM